MFQYILDSTDAGVEAFVFDTWRRFVVVADPILVTLLTISLAVLGYRVWLGQTRITLGDLGYRVFVMFFVYGLVISVPDLTEYVYRLFTDVPESVASFLVSGAGFQTDGLNASIGLIYSRGTESAAALWRDAGVTALGPALLAFFVLIATILAVGVVAVVAVLGKLATGVLLGLAPFFITLYMFQSTRSLFEGYLRQLITFALVPVLLYSLVGLMFGMVDSVSRDIHAQTMAGEGTFALCSTYALIMVVWAFVSAIVVPWAAGIGGGLALAIPNFAAGGALQSAGRAVSPASAQTSLRAFRVAKAEGDGGRVRRVGRGLIGSIGSGVRGSLGMRQRPEVERYRGKPAKRAPTPSSVPKPSDPTRSTGGGPAA